MDVNPPTTASEVVQDPALDTTKLAADLAPKFLAEAKRLYHNSKPPFVTTPSGSTRRPVFVAKDGQRPLRPIRTDLVAKLWGPHSVDGIYWTLDLNGERYIVQSFPNRGCISGAKWVYCSWTGVGEEFEDQPLAFTCINGEYTSTLGPRLEYTSATNQSTVKETTMTSTTADSVRHDLPPDMGPLPQDHPVEYLDQAKALYMGSRPPFVIMKTKNPRRRVLLAKQDGLYSATSTKTEVVYRQWDSVNDYATLDLDGKRFIVCGNAGGYPGGYQYHLWLGSKAGRDRKVAAYCGPQADMKKASSGLIEHRAEVDEGANSLSSSNDEDDQDTSASAIGREAYFYNTFRKAFDPTTIPSSTPGRFSTHPPNAYSEPSVPNERLRRTSKPAKRARSPTPPAHFGPRANQALAHLPKRVSHGTRHVSDDTSDLSSPPYETPARTPKVNDRPDSSSTAQTPQTQAPTSLPALTLYKQTHTTLRATRDSNIIGFVPLRLLTCMTMSALFSSVVAASGHRGHEEPIKLLMAIFDWKDEIDVYKTIYIDKGTEGSFEIFLEIINEAPCWKDEGGKCGIAIEVVRA